MYHYEHMRYVATYEQITQDVQLLFQNREGTTQKGNFLCSKGYSKKIKCKVDILNK